MCACALIYTQWPLCIPRSRIEMEVLSADKWLLCLDSKGRILDQYTIRKIAFHMVRRLSLFLPYSKEIELKLSSTILCYIQLILLTVLMRLCPLQGISDEIRAEVWPFLLGYYPFDSTSEERTKIDEDKRFVLMHTKFVMFD